MVTTSLDILVVAPHPDDAEIGTGGMLLSSQRAGLKVGIVELTNGEPTPHGSPEIRARETSAATEILKLDFRENLGLPNRSLEASLDARRSLAEVFRRTRPKTIFAPYWEDVHPDHVSASQLCDAARFWSKLSKTDMAGEPFWPPRMLYFWSIHLKIHPKPAFVLDISDVIEDKMRAIKAYHSQFGVGRSTEFPTLMDDIRDRARYWGWTIGKAYGEPFGSREDLGLSTITSLV